MNRRTLLKGAAAGSTLMFSMRLGVHHSRAQAPSYVAELIQEFTTFKEESYVFASDGIAVAVTSDDTILGTAVVDGRTSPVIWDLSGTQSVLDTGDIPFGGVWNLFVNKSGMIAGSFSEEPKITSRGFIVVWDEGIPAVLEASDPAKSAVVLGLNDDGVIVGGTASVATRWIDGKMEQLPVPAGAETSAVVAVARSGDGYGWARTNSDGIVGLPWIWRLDGTIGDLSLPESLLGDPAVEIAGLRYPALYDDGGYVVVIGQAIDDVYQSDAFVFDGIGFTPLPTLALDTHSSVSFAPSAAEIYGTITGVGESTGPTVWIDKQPTLLRGQVTVPPGTNLGTIIGATSTGELVARTSPFGDATIPGTLLLRPA